MGKGEGEMKGSGSFVILHTSTLFKFYENAMLYS